MNAAVTVGLGKASGAVVLIGPEVPIREQLRSVKRKEVEVPPGVDVIEVWSRNTGVLKRRKIKSSAGPEIPTASEEVSDFGDGEDSPVAEVQEKKAARKKRS